MAKRMNWELEVMPDLGTMLGDGFTVVAKRSRSFPEGFAIAN
jgi:hypothetical protein